MPNKIDYELLKSDFLRLADCWLSVMEGDTYLIDDAYEILKRRKVVNEEGFKTYPEDDEEFKHGSKK